MGLHDKPRRESGELYIAKRRRYRRSGKNFAAAAAIIVVVVIVAVSWFLLAHSRRTTAPAATPSVSVEPSYIDQTMAGMSLRDKVASLFIFHTPGTDPATLSQYAKSYKPAGLIFMEDNIPATKNELRAETAALTTDKQLPPLIAIDEEGDTVKRLGSDTYPGALTLADLPPNASKDAFAKRSDLLQHLGFNLNFGIVADETDNPNSFIFPRVLGTTPQAAADRVAAAVEGSKGKTLTTLKHFPGHGETTANSHMTIPLATTSLSTWQQGPALPFKSGINAGADLVMFGQLAYTAVDQQPATLSKAWHDILRDQLGFKGLTVTDDMIMLQGSGDPAYSDPVANAVAAIKAGNDLLLYVLDHDSETSRINPDKLIDGVVAAVKAGKLSQSDIDQHVRAVLNVRHDLAQGS